jgi:hypothetical protein
VRKKIVEKKLIIFSCGIIVPIIKNSWRGIMLNKAMDEIIEICDACRKWYPQ